MLNIKLTEETTLCVSSEWDSGTHLGFKANVHEKGEYAGKSLDKVLSKSQILEIEALIACRLRGILRKEGNFIKEFDEDYTMNLQINAAKVVEELVDKKE